MSSRKTVSLVLGSGSSRGWAHIGAIEALEGGHIPIDSIVGCSIGSYVGAIYAAGGIQSLKEFVLRMDGKKVFSYFDIVLPRSGLLNGTKKLRELYSMHTNARDFAELQVPVMMVATDLETGAKVVLNSGSIMEALRATMSIPGIFAPARVKNRWLVDGGLVDPVPVDVARATGAEVVIAVNLASRIVSRKKWTNPAKPVRLKPPGHQENKDEEQKSELIRKLAEFYTASESSLKHKIREILKKESAVPDIMEAVTNSINIMQDQITRINLAVSPPDILIQPRLGGLKMFDFDHVEHTIEEGYIAVREKMEDIKMLLASG
jgi:NTE family protein